jgi:molybdopterin-dependent oxidoreductase alpha subunit
MEEAARIACASKRLIACWAMGLTQHKNGVANVQEVMNFLLLRGQIGRKGAGACPVRGHSNVQGDRTMGITEKPSERFLADLGTHFGFDPPTHHGLDTVHAIKAMLEGKGKVFIGMGGNFLSATPDTEATARALRHCDLTVHISTKLNRSHLVTGKTALILPCLGRTEIDIQKSGPQIVSVENSMGVVHASRGGNKPVSEWLMSEVAIVAGIAEATITDTVIPWSKMRGNYDLIRDAIEACIPGFEAYNQRLRTPHGFELPNGPRQGDFKTPDGKAHFRVHPLPEHPLKPGEFLMMTIRTHDQYNTTVYGMDDRYRGIYNGRRVVLMNAHDRSEAGLEPGDKVTLVNTFNQTERRAPNFVVVDYDIPRRSVATYFPEANVLIPLDSFADGSHTPTSKSVVVSLAKSV